jgi:hypothetical protein
MFCVIGKASINPWYSLEINLVFQTAFKIETILSIWFVQWLLHRENKVLHLQKCISALSQTGSSLAA